MTRHLRLASPPPPEPTGSSREAVMDHLVEARHRLCDLYGHIGDPALTGHLRGGGRSTPAIVQEQIEKAHAIAATATAAEQEFRRALDAMHKTIEEESQ